MKTFYYIFKVTDSLGKEYYILNNRYIGYVGFDSDNFRSLLESRAKITKTYKLFAKLKESSSEELHKLNCDSTRFSFKEITDLTNKYKDIVEYALDSTEYEVYFPNKNSSESYLKEVGGESVIK